MKSKTKPRKPDSLPVTADSETPTDVEPAEDADLDEIDDSQLEDAEQSNDEQWEVFLFDDEDEPLPEFGDFWLPD